MIAQPCGVIQMATRQTSVGGHSGRKCGKTTESVPAFRFNHFWFNHFALGYRKPERMVDRMARTRGLAAQMRPRHERSSGPRRAQGRPGARCTRGLVCNVHKEVRTRAYRSSGEHPAFPAQWFDGLCRASPETNSSCLRHRRIDGFARPGWACETSADLTPATGARTTRFCRTQLPSPNHSTSHLRPAEVLAEAFSAVRLHG